jgi:predicted ATPase
MVTLVGPPGIGKTHLGIELARSMLNEFEDGAFFVSLAPITDPDLVAASLAHTLNLPILPTLPALTTLKHALRDKHMLLVLDNFEQVLGAASVVAELLTECVWLKVIVTSREPLHLRIERQFAVPPLALPSPIGSSVWSGVERKDEDVTSLNRHAAIALFVERAQAAQVNFDLTAENAVAVTSICTSLDGNPLGIELAASWVNTLACNEIAREIRRNLDFLTATMQDMPERHRSLRAAFDHSWKLLSQPEQRALSRLSVFRGGFEREAAERVAGATLPVLSALVTKSLVRRSESSRYDMHEFVKQYATERLRMEAQTKAVASMQSDTKAHRCHALYFLDFALTAEQQLHGPYQAAWLDRLDQEHDNFRAALRWVLDSHDGELAARLGGAIWQMWFIRGYYSEGRKWLAEILAAIDSRSTSDTPIQLYAKVVTGAASLASAQGELAVAQALFESLLVPLRASGDKLSLAHVLTRLGYTVSDNDYAETLLTEGLELLRTLDHTRGIANTLRILGDRAANRQDYANAARLYEESLSKLGQVDDRSGIARALTGLGYVAFAQMDYTRATDYAEQSLRLYLELSYRYGIAGMRFLLGHIAFVRQDHVQAAALYRQALELSRELGAMDLLVLLLWAFVDLAQAQSQPRRAALLFSATEAARQFQSTTDFFALLFKPDIAAIGAQLGEAALSAAWAEGQAMSLEQVVAFALRIDQE